MIVPDSPVLDVVVAPAGYVPRYLRELVVVLSVQLHHQGILLGGPNLVLLDARVYVVVVSLTALFGRSPRHHLRDLGPAVDDINKEKRKNQQR